MEKRLVLKVGSQGDDVRILQEKIGIPADGVFGAETRRAVVAFQKKNGLSGDGIVGPRTWNILGVNPEEFYADTDTITSATWIERYHLPDAEYVKKETSKKYIFLHHTAGRHNPYKVVDQWAVDQRGRIGTNYIIGGLPASADLNNLSDAQKKYDGRILQAIDDKYHGYHLGPNGSSFMTEHSLSIEICSAGSLTKKGEKYYTWYNEEVHPSQVVVLERPFRGTKYYHAYSTSQLQALEALLRHLSEKHDINLKSGMQRMGENMYEWSESAWGGQVTGLLSHTNVRKDKSDVFPQPELTSIIVSF